MLLLLTASKPCHFFDVMKRKSLIAGLYPGVYSRVYSEVQRQCTEERRDELTEKVVGARRY
jgi:hypothetical protein